jgi:tetratricopeptide (TPR) repeat protein
LGIALTEIARYEEAERALSKAIEHCPSSKLWITFGAMGHLHKAAGDFGRAEEWYRRTIAQAPEDATGYIYLGSLLATLGRLVEAEEITRSATQCPEGCIDEAFRTLGLILLYRERFEEAAECLREAIRRDPEYRGAKEALRDAKACLRERRQH